MSNGSASSLTFVIPVKDDAVRLSRCLASIARNNSRARVACLVADNGSTDATVDVAKSAAATVLSLPGLRVSAVRNRAAKTASADLLAFVDADHEISSGWVTAAVEGMADESVGAVGALCLPPPDGTDIQRMFGVLRGRTKGRTEVTWLGSGNLVVRQKVFEQLGGFDETLETCEDVDFCQRLRDAGWLLVGDERLENVHLGDPSTLRAVFTSERWRGRDNLRVSLRRRPSLRDWPSILIPVVGAASLVLLPILIASNLVFGRPGLFVTSLPLAAILGLSGLRALKMAVGGRLQSLADLFLAYAVALAYDLGRAASLILPAGHKVRRQTDAATGRA